MYYVKISNKKDDKIIVANAIKARGDEENACCPNCGHLGKISSYIDGCDYCNSKFSVTDFEEKISAFCLVENTPKKVLQIFKKIALVIGILALVMGFLSIVSIIVAIILDMSGASATLLLMPKKLTPTQPLILPMLLQITKMLLNAHFPNWLLKVLKNKITLTILMQI